MGAKHILFKVAYLIRPRCPACSRCAGLARPYLESGAEINRVPRNDIIVIADTKNSHHNSLHETIL